MKRPLGKAKPAPAKAEPAGLDLSIVSALAKIAAAQDLSEVEIEHRGLKVRVARHRAAHPGSAAHFAPAAPDAAPPVAVVAAPALLPRELPGAVKSPMVGTAYLRPSPEAKAFIEIGAQVKAGDKILLVEAMKTFNEILAPHAGRVTHIFVDDGTPVEYNQPLLVIE